MESDQFWPTIQKGAEEQEVRPVMFPDRPLQSGRLFVPRDVQLVADGLVWKSEGARYRHVTSAMFLDFLGICDKHDDPSAILSYARKWGVLGICKHALPSSHNQYAYGLADGVPPCLPVLVTPLPSDGADFQFWEPISLWYGWSGKFKALLNIATGLNQGKRASREDWNTVTGIQNTGLELGDEVEVPEARKEVADILDGWISMGQVRPRMAWNRAARSWRFSLDAVTTGPNLFGLLALFLAREMASSEYGIAICTSCGHAYSPSRRPDPHRRNYCQKCGKQAALRDAARDFRRRHRERRSE